jgi:hypothetical protein
MRTALLSLFILLATKGHCQTHSHRKLLTDRYAGDYSYGKNVEKEAVGSITIYPETDTTVLFYIDLCKGAPSYDLGQLYARLKIKNREGLYFSKEDYNKKGCKWQVTINGDTLTIKTIDDFYDCPFGYGVIADHQYIRKSSKKYTYFINGEGHKIFFSKTSPQDYLK